MMITYFKRELINHGFFQVLKWHNEGLPNDSHSTENALIVKKAHKWPVFIDPQGQAFKYVSVDNVF